MATTITYFVDDEQAFVSLPGVKHSVSKFISLADKNTASGDTVQLVKVPAGAIVDTVMIVIDTAEGGTLTATVGDGSDPDRYDAEVNLNATAGTVTKNDAVGTDKAGHLYTSADTIDLVMSANAGDTAEFTITVEYSMLDPKAIALLA